MSAEQFYEDKLDRREAKRRARVAENRRRLGEWASTATEEQMRAKAIEMADDPGRQVKRLAARRMLGLDEGCGSSVLAGLVASQTRHVVLAPGDE